MSGLQLPAELRRRNRRFGVLSLLLAAVIGAGFATGVGDAVATFTFDEPFGDPTFLAVPALRLPVAVTLVSLALVLAGLGAAQLVRGFASRTNAVVAVAVTLFVLAFLVWAARDEQLSAIALLRGTVRGAVPLTFGALAGVLCERSGVINIAIEAQFLAAAFTAAVVASVTGSPWLGLVGGLLAGGLVGVVLAVLTIRYRADQIVVGVVLVVLATGLTSFLLSQVLTRNNALNSPVRFRPATVPLLGDLPVVGPLLFRQSVMVYLVLLAVVGVHLVLFHTRWGLRVRAVGENPRAADTVGIRVLGTRYVAVIVGGMIAGMGGAYFTLDSASQFSRGMSAGQGFIALAAMLAGRYSPVGAFGAALVFGFAGALATALQLLQVGIPSTLLLTAPYVATIFVVAGLVGRLRVPAADGQPYVKE